MYYIYLLGPVLSVKVFFTVKNALQFLKRKTIKIYLHEKWEMSMIKTVKKYYRRKFKS